MRVGKIALLRPRDGGDDVVGLEREHGDLERQPAGRILHLAALGVRGDQRRDDRFARAELARVVYRQRAERVLRARRLRVRREQRSHHLVGVGRRVWHAVARRAGGGDVQRQRVVGRARQPDRVGVRREQRGDRLDRRAELAREVQRQLAVRVGLLAAVGVGFAEVRDEPGLLLHELVDLLRRVPHQLLAAARQVDRQPLGAVVGLDRDGLGVRLEQRGRHLGRALLVRRPLQGQPARPALDRVALHRDGLVLRKLGEVVVRQDEALLVALADRQEGIVLVSELLQRLRALLRLLRRHAPPTLR